MNQKYYPSVAITYCVYISLYCYLMRYEAYEGLLSDKEYNDVLNGAVP